MTCEGLRQKEMRGKKGEQETRGSKLNLWEMRGGNHIRQMVYLDMYAKDKLVQGFHGRSIARVWIIRHWSCACA